MLAPMATQDIRASHTFVVPAFGEPAWLERCVVSLLGQTRRSPVVIATSTPNSHIASVAHLTGVPVIVNDRGGGIARDWNFALAQAATPWVTLAHQDDWYDPGYTEACLLAAGQVDQPIIVFTDATETIEGSDATLMNTRVKRAISGSVFGPSRSITSLWRKRMLLSFGNPIACPSVMINLHAAAGFRFPEGWKSNLDWSAWFALAQQPGAFVYVARRLVHRTMHLGAETTRALADRAREDAQMFRMLWPAPIAAALNLLYSPSRHLYATMRQER
jgi:glycosyl transferase family 2